MANNTYYAAEIEAGDLLVSGQTFKVADDSGLNVSGQEICIDSTYWVETDAEDAGTDWRGTEMVTFNIRPRHAGLTHKVIMPRARVLRLVF